MTISFYGMCVAEWRKIRGRGLAYAVLLFGLLHGIAVPFLADLLGPVFGWVADNVLKHPAEEASLFDWLVAGDLSLTAATSPLNSLVLLLLASVLWSQDFSLGTMAMIFVRPVSRLRVFLSKVAVCWGLAFASLGLALAAGLLIGMPLFGSSGDVGTLAQIETCISPPCWPYVSWMAEVSDEALAAGDAAKPVVLGVIPRLLGIFQGLLLGTLMMGPLLGLTALIANLTRSPVLTLFGSLFILLADGMVHWALWAWGKVDSLVGNEAAGELSEWTIWASRDFYGLHGSGELFAQGGQNLLATTIYTVVFFGLAGLLFIRRDVT